MAHLPVEAGCDLPFPNLFVKPVPPGCDELSLMKHFSKYGEISSIRICQGTPGSRPTVAHAFVRFCTTTAAAMALGDPAAGFIEGHVVTVKLADGDMAPKIQSGMCESEWCYVRGLPPGFPNDQVVALFSPFGKIIDMKYFPSTTNYKGTGALLRYSLVSECKNAIIAMNGLTFPGCVQPLLVRFADSPAEKAAKASRRDKNVRKALLQASGRVEPGLDVSQQQWEGVAGHMVRSMSGSVLMNSGISNMDRVGSMPIGTTSEQVAIADTFVAGSTGASPIQYSIPEMGNSVAGKVPFGQPSGPFAGNNPALGFVLSVKNLHSEVDKLWIYENFSRFGAILQAIVSVNGQGMPTEASVIFLDLNAALLAKEAMNGMSVEGKILQVTIQLDLGKSSNHISESPNVVLNSTIPTSSVLSDDVLEQSFSGLSMSDRLGSQ